MHQKDTSHLLWRDSPCTLRCVLQNPSMDNSKRFHYGSIYFRDDVNKPKKVFTQFEKPELLLINFRRQLEEVQIRARKNSRNNQGPTSVREKLVAKHVTSPLDVKLYERPVKIEFKHDRHGNRSSYQGDYDVKQLTERLKQTKINFYSSHRIDLSKPDNFYPGPGSYFREGDQRPMRHTYSERLKAISLNKQT